MTRLAPLLILFTAMAAQAAGPAPRERIERGRYLINATGCMDCHTPLKNGPRGPEPDRTRLFAGHPEALAMPPAPALPAGPWLVVASATNTAWAGPWGVSIRPITAARPAARAGKRNRVMASFLSHRRLKAATFCVKPNARVRRK